MQYDTHKNFALGIIATPPSPATSGTTFTLNSGDGYRFEPNMPVTLTPPETEPAGYNSEIGYITGVAGDVLTVLRAQEGSTAKEVASGWIIRGTVTAKLLTDIEENKVEVEPGKGLSSNDYTTAEKTKLAGLASGATQNASDAALRDRTTHTGSQAIGTVTGLQTALDSKIESDDIADFETTTELNARDSANRSRSNHTGTQAISTVTGLQTALDSKATPADVSTAVAGLVDAAPGTLDTLNELAAALGDDPNFAATVTTQIGTKADASALTSHTSNTSNPHSVTKAQVGLGNVDNTSDANKPVSTATQTALTARQFKTVVTVGTSGADYLFGSYALPRDAINAAIDAMNAAGGGIVQLVDRTITNPGRITPKSNVLVRGYRGSTLFFGGAASNYIFSNSNASPITNFGIEDIVIDCNNVTASSGIRLNKATACYGTNVTIKNVPASGWGMVIGSTEVDNVQYCFDNTFEDFVFDTHAGSLEMLLVFQARNTTFLRPKFINKTTTGPVIGVYQSTKNTIFEYPTFIDNVGFGCYYSLTSHDTYFNRPYFENCGGGFQGANQADNDGGNYGESQTKGLYITDPVFIGGANSLNSVAIQLGAVDSVVVTNPIIENYDIGIVFNGGNGLHYPPMPATNFLITNPKILNPNASAATTSIDLHPGILFTEVGGTMYGKITGPGYIRDDRATKQMRFAINFNGSLTYNELEISGLSLPADVANGGRSIRRGSATFGNSVSFYANTDWSGSDPEQIQKYVSTGIQIDTGGATRYLRWGDSGRIRGNNGNLELSAVPTSSFLRLQNYQQTTQSNFDLSNGHLSIGQGITAATGVLDIAGSTTSAASLRIRSGTAPTSPNDGDIWQDGTNLKMRIGGSSQDIATKAYADSGDAAREPSIAPASISQYFRGDKSWQTLDQDAVPDGTTNKAFTSIEKAKLGAITGTNTGDQNATTVFNTPAGNISATTVQGAINELDTEKAADANTVHLTGNETITGNKLLTPTANSTSTLRITRQDGTTEVFDVDTTNARVGIGNATPSETLHVGVGGATGYLKFGDSWRMRGNSGHAELNITNASAGKQFRFISQPLVTLMNIDQDSANVAIGTGTTAGTSRLQVAGSFSVPIVTKTTNYTAAVTDHTLLCDATSGNITITLPAVSTISGRLYVIKKTDSSANTITIDGNSSETIDGATTLVLTTQWETKTIQSNGSAWFVL